MEDEKSEILALLEHEIKVIKTSHWGEADEARMRRIMQRIDDNLEIKTNLLPIEEQDEDHGPHNDKEAFGDSFHRANADYVDDGSM